MPLYEYFCADCNGVFELLRPARQATIDQPCPECDADAKRIMSKEFATFVYRDGYARRIPDDGSYYHMGQKVRRAMTSSGDGYTHPELAEKKGAPKPELDDIEQYAEICVEFVTSCCTAGISTALSVKSSVCHRSNFGIFCVT